MPTLNWRELETYVQLIRPFVEGSSIEQIIVPERKELKAEFAKQEWVFRLRSHSPTYKGNYALHLRLTARSPSLSLSQGKGPKASLKASRSAFDLILQKELKDSQFVSFQALSQERVIEAKFNSGLKLYFLLIPAKPEALLVDSDNHILSSTRASTRSRPGREEATLFVPPLGHNAPPDLPIRSELFITPWEFHRQIDTDQKSDGIAQQIDDLLKKINHQLKQLSKKRSQAHTALEKAKNQPNTTRWGELLKSVLHDPPPCEKGIRKVYDYSDEEWIAIPCDPQLSVQEQAEKFFKDHKKTKRRIEESEERLRSFDQEIETQTLLLKKVQALQGQEPSQEVHNQLRSLFPSQSSSSVRNRKKKKWKGKAFQSQEGLSLWVGKNLSENLDLTFKFAHGNDLWMHVRGKPGAHLVIPLSHQRTASLDTLLDAAQLVIYFSGGKSWGKTEVDYTYRKHVKRIKNSKEVSYSQEKTLVVEPNPERIKVLLSSQIEDSSAK